MKCWLVVVSVVYAFIRKCWLRYFFAVNCWWPLKLRKQKRSWSQTSSPKPLKLHFLKPSVSDVVYYTSTFVVYSLQCMNMGNCHFMLLYLRSLNVLLFLLPFGWWMECCLEEGILTKASDIQARKPNPHNTRYHRREEGRTNPLKDKTRIHSRSS